MNFSDLFFLYAFLPLCLIIYFISPKIKYKNTVLISIYSVDPNGIVTSINGRILDEQVEGIYSTNGMKQDRLMPGMNIIRYANGKTKTVLVK